MPTLTADDLRRWADYMDNPEQCERPGGPNPAALSDLLGACTAAVECHVLRGLPLETDELAAANACINAVHRAWI